MGSISHLDGLGLIASGFLRILAAYVLFIVLTLLASRHWLCHALWFLFLAGAGLYWIILAAQVVRPLAFANGNDRSITDLPAASSAATQVTIPFDWYRPLELTGGILLFVYAGVLIFMLGGVVRRSRVLREAVARARPVSPELSSIFGKLSKRLEIPACRILELPGLCSPGTAYTRTPVILIPEGLEFFLDSEQVIDVLYHELIHVRRLDFLWGVLGEIVACLLFFHPGVWLALKNLGRERELACDSAVMESRHGRRTDYALCLTRLARRRVLGCQLDPASHLISLNSFLALRVQALLTANQRRGPVKQSAAFSGGVLALSVFFIGWLSLSLAIDVAGPPASYIPMVHHVYSVPSKKLIGRHLKPHVLSTEASRRLPNPPALHEIFRMPKKDTSAADVGNQDIIASRGVESSGSPEVDEGPVWDESPPSMSRHGPISWRRTVIGAAVGALGRVAQGRTDDDDDDDKGPKQH
jgi:beta-lactamase regulating signal transducer with metallopeptidase domain